MSFPVSASDLASFQGRLGHSFSDPALLERSLTHRSWCAEHASYASNERLEFLGDSVLGVLVTHDIYHRYPEAGEGQLSRVRASVVCAPALAEMARELGVGDVLLLGKGEDASGGRERLSILADAMEAVIGAVYLDGGPVAAHGLVDRLVAPRLDVTGAQDHKSQLHEWAARDHAGVIHYVIVEDGPEHDKTFRAEVFLGGESFGTGVGRSKKLAEQAAASVALTRLEPQRGAQPAREESHG